MKLNSSISAIAMSLAGLCTVAAHAEVPTLFISEYLEGASNNKALELYNNTSSGILLDNYRIEIYFNGSTSAGTTLKLSGTLAAGKTYVIANSSASFADTADKTSGALSFNGNDAVVLKNGDTILDSLGQIGSSAYWSNASGTVVTQDMDLRRSSTVTDIDPTCAVRPRLPILTQLMYSIPVHNGLPMEKMIFPISVFMVRMMAVMVATMAARR
ncbi:lamin tail domain-containing protein [Shewanella sp. A32]|uniref:lamin tail domain-containing protein n=1 Tax=Shewanella sp. A32 TaxID=3031327 RepID=UPI0023B94BE9|nr:lamin tail domain-containing protein [Shewanella sp. A32]MDF0534065.1 lamin tail domain-containing protein [Shewanella sp. A32]